MQLGMNIFAVGVNHKTSSVEVREKVHFKSEEIISFLPVLMQDYMDEAVIVSTCNRTEIYGTLKFENTDVDDIINTIIHYKDAGTILTKKQFYTLFDNEAVKHLLEVSSSIDSLIIGDVQVLTQVKEAYKISADNGFAGNLLHKVFQTAIRTGKRVKTETSISEGAVSVSYAAVELSEKIFDDISTKNVLIIGAGETAELAAQQLTKHGIASLSIANRTFEKAVALCGQFDGTPIRIEEISEKLPSIDILISSVSSDGYILNKEEIMQAMSKRNSRTLLIIDIGIPRNIDPDAANIENVFLENIDSLNEIAKGNYSKRMSELPKIQKIIEEEIKTLFLWYHARTLTPVFEQVKMKYDEIRVEEIERYKTQFSKEEFQLVNTITKSIVAKIFKTSSVNLRESLNEQSEIENSKIIPFVKRILGVS